MSLNNDPHGVHRNKFTGREYRAVFSFPASILGETPDRYSDPVTDEKYLPVSVPDSEENHGWVSGIQSRPVGEWETTSD